MCVLVCMCMCVWEYIEIYICVCAFVCVCVCRQTQSKCVNEHISAARFILRNWLTPLPILSGVCRVGQLTGASEESWHCSSSSNIVHCRLSSSREVSLFLLRPSSGWMRPVHIMEGNLLYWVYWFKCECHPRNIFSEASRIPLDQISGPAKLT